MESKVLENVRMYMQTAYTDYLLDRQLTDDPDVDFTCAKKRHDLLKDLFHNFYRKDLKDNPEVAPNLKKVFDTLNKIDDFKNLRNTTIMDRGLSYAASVKFEEEFKRLLRELEMKEHADFDIDPDALGEYIKGNGDAFRFRLRQILKKTQEEVDMQQSLTGLGIGKEANPGEAFKTTVDLKKMSKRMLANPNHKRIIELLGRFKRIAESNMRTKTSGLEELVGITMGSDIDNVIPEEIAEFMDDDTEVVFLDKYTNGNLLQYDTQAKEPEGKGDMLAVLDESGSMVYGQVMIEPRSSYLEASRAILFGLATIAKRDKRRLRVIRFDGAAIEQIFETMDDIMDFALNGPVKGGGTSYDNMMTKVVDVMKEEKKKKSDVIIISDGEANITKDVLNDYLKAKEELGFKVVSLMIGARADELRKISDTVFDNITGKELSPDSPTMKAVFGV